MADLLHFTVEGIEQLGDALSQFVEQLVAELQPGFVPEHRYHGEGGVPFTLEKIALVGSQQGFFGG